MTWTYDEKPFTGLLWEVKENGRRLFLVYRASTKTWRDALWSRFVWDGPYIGSGLQLDPFRLHVDCYDPNLDDGKDPGPLPVFVYQEEEIPDVVTFKNGPTTVYNFNVTPMLVSARHEVDCGDHDEWVLVVNKTDFVGHEWVKDVSLVKLPKGVVRVTHEVLA